MFLMKKYLELGIMFHYIYNRIVNYVSDLQCLCREVNYNRVICCSYEDKINE